MNELDNSYQYCEYITKNHYENFPVASLLIPSNLRKHIFSVYTFARIADDIADEGSKRSDERIDELNIYKNSFLTKTNSNAFQHFPAVYDTIDKFNLPIDLFSNLLDAFIQDNMKNEYNSFEELLNYCKCSANPIGRILLIIFGYRDELLFSKSDSICTALQLTNFWQDTKIDLLRNRCYLPLEDLKKFNYKKEDLFNFVYSNEFCDLMKFQIERTEKLFSLGEDLPNFLRGLFKLEIKLTISGGKKILTKIKRNNYNTFNYRPTLNTLDKANLFLKLFYE
ncbi:MAG: squalene synthase HpnC [Ignavibacteria bacterium]|nr:squalene synthase HpnC [Ignavibacteria bacterium]